MTRGAAVALRTLTTGVMGSGETLHGTITPGRMAANGRTQVGPTDGGVATAGEVPGLRPLVAMAETMAKVALATTLAVQADKDGDLVILFAVTAAALSMEDEAPRRRWSSQPSRVKRAETSSGPQRDHICGRSPHGNV